MSSCGPDGDDASSMQTISITIPPLPCSFTCMNHPDAPTIKQMSDQWVVDRCRDMASACKGARAASFFAAEHLVDSAFYLLATLFYANAASSHLLLPIVKLMNWYFMLDNIVDDPSELGTEPAQASYLIDRVADVFKLNGTTYISQSDEEMKTPGSSTRTSCEYVDRLVSVIAGCAAEWWGDMCMDMTPEQQVRFSIAFTEYLHANKVQVQHRMSQHLPNPQAYFNIRRKSISCYPCYILTEYSLGVELHPQVLSHPLMQALLEKSAEHVILINDITSFRKEYLDGDLFNVVFVLCYNKRVNGGEQMEDQWVEKVSQGELQEAMQEACTMLKQRDEDCVRLVEEIKRCAMLMEKPGTARCLEGFSNMLGGNLYWHLMSGRYGLDKRSISEKHTQPLDLLAPRQICLPPFKL